MNPPFHLRKRKGDCSSSCSSTPSVSNIQTKRNKLKGITSECSISDQGKFSREEMGSNVTDYLVDHKWSTKLDTKLASVMIKARKQKGDFKGLAWSDERVWQCAVEKINVFISSTDQDCEHLEQKGIECLKSRLHKLRKAYNKYKDESNWTLRIKLAKLFTCEGDMGPLVIPKTFNNSRAGPSRSHSSYSAMASQSVNQTCAEDTDVVGTFLQNLRAIKNSISTEQYSFAIQDFKTSLHMMVLFNQMTPQERISYLEYMNKRS